MSYAVPVPAAGPSAKPLANPVTVVNPQFQADYPVDLVITEKMLSLKESKVLSQSPTLMEISCFRSKVPFSAFMIVALCLTAPILTAHKRWHIYRGESSDQKDLLFTARKSSILQLKTELDVFLAGNTEEEAHDFKVKGSWGERSCTIYNANNTILAQMHKKHDLKSIFFGRDAFAVTVYPHVDYAFIIAIVVVLHEINMDRLGED